MCFLFFLGGAWQVDLLVLDEVSATHPGFEDLHAHFERHHFQLPFIAMNWLIPLFTTQLPAEVSSPVPYPQKCCLYMWSLKLGREVEMDLFSPSNSWANSPPFRLAVDCLTTSFRTEVG